MKKILITGASGFLGRRAAEYFKERYEVLTPTHQEMDITDEESVKAFFVKYMPDAVIHCAAISDVGRCEKEPEMSQLINVNGSIHIAKAAKLTGTKPILCSSDQVYFRSTVSGAHKEEEILTPGNVYGRQKLLAEEECLKENPDCVMLRLSWMYDKESKSVSEHSDFMRTLLAKLKVKESLSYPLYDLRGISDVNEVIVNMEKLFTVSGGVYNFGSPNEKNTYELMCQVFEELGWDQNMLEKNEEAFSNQPRNISMCQDKINAAGIYFTPTGEQIIKNLKNIVI